MNLRVIQHFMLVQYYCNMRHNNNLCTFSDYISNIYLMAVTSVLAYQMFAVYNFNSLHMTRYYFEKIKDICIKYFTNTTRINYQNTPSESKNVKVIPVFISLLNQFFLPPTLKQERGKKKNPSVKYNMDRKRFWNISNNFRALN